VRRTASTWLGGHAPETAGGGRQAGRLLGRRRRYPRELGVALAPASVFLSLRSPTIWLDGRATPHPSPLAHPTPWLLVGQWAIELIRTTSLALPPCSIHEDKAHGQRGRGATSCASVSLTTHTKPPLVVCCRSASLNSRRRCPKQIRDTGTWHCGNIPAEQQQQNNKRRAAGSSGTARFRHLNSRNWRFLESTYSCPRHARRSGGESPSEPHAG
jgi:hypothetical protein